MNKIAVVYWSGTGNTEMMAQAIAEGVKSAGGGADLLSFGEFTADSFSAYGAAAFGCPAMGAEELEESEVEPAFSALEGRLSGKRVALFGSYGWGDGEWMRNWCRRCSDAGAVLHDTEGLMVNETPDDGALSACKALGAALATW